VTPITKPAKRQPKARKPIARSRVNVVAVRFKKDKALLIFDMKRPKRRVPLGAKRAAVKAAGYVDPDSWALVLSFYSWLCAYCQEQLWEQQDHCRPLSRGGKHEIGNVVPSCARCNYRKGTQTWWPKRRHQFMEEIR
jgi:hypothetical protein